MLDILLDKQEATGETPDALRERPHLWPENQCFWECFQDLSATRRFEQFGPLAITFQELLAWLQMHSVDREVWEAYKRVIRAMDTAWLRAMQDQRGGKNG